MGFKIGNADLYSRSALRRVKRKKMVGNVNEEFEKEKKNLQKSLSVESQIENFHRII
jgi:hypothetical protein